MTSKVFVAGVGMIQFRKPGTSARYDEMGSQAVRAALADDGIGISSSALKLRSSFRLRSSTRSNSPMDWEG
jgi:hypothetical protein